MSEDFEEVIIVPPSPAKAKGSKTTGKACPKTSPSFKPKKMTEKDENNQGQVFRFGKYQGCNVQSSHGRRTVLLHLGKASAQEEQVSAGVRGLGRGQLQHGR